MARLLARMPDLKDRVAAKIAEMRPYLERSGGKVDLVEVEDGIAKLRVELTRPGPSRLVASLQLKSGVERALRTDIPESARRRGHQPAALFGAWLGRARIFCPTNLPLPSDLDGDHESSRGLTAARAAGSARRGRS